MNKSHISKSGTQVFLKIIITMGLSISAFITQTVSAQDLQVAHHNNNLLSTVILANTPSSADIKKHSSKTLKMGSKGDAVEENADKTLTKPEQPTESRAAYIKLGDIKGESSDAESKVPAHTPEWTDYNEHDPGTTDNSQDDKESEPKTGKSLIGHELTHVTQSSSSVDAKHKEWINIESVSQAGMNKSDLVDAIAKKKNLDTDGLIGPKTNRAKESGEKGGTTDMNIGLGELQESKEGLSKELIDKNKPCKDDCQESD